MYMKHNITTAFIIALTASSNAAVLLSSGFDGNTGAPEIKGTEVVADDTSGSSTLTVNDWTAHASVTTISNLTKINSDNGVDQNGGFLRLNDERSAWGVAPMANDNTVFINNNLNDGTKVRKRGFSFDFTTDAPWDLTNLTVLAAHAKGNGYNQSYISDLTIEISGGDLASSITDSKTQDYSGPEYHSLEFDLRSAPTLSAGDYTLKVYMTNLQNGGAYASFDGITLNVQAIPEPSSVLLGSLGMLFLLRRRR